MSKKLKGSSIANVDEIGGYWTYPESDEPETKWRYEAIPLQSGTWSLSDMKGTILPYIRSDRHPTIEEALSLDDLHAYLQSVIDSRVGIRKKMVALHRFVDKIMGKDL